MKSKITFYAWIIVTWLVSICGFIRYGGAAEIGDQLADAFKNNVVQLTVKLDDGHQQYGFGFIVAEQSGSLYVVTAGHVVRTDDPDVKVESVKAQFYSARGKSSTARALDLFESDLDLAVLEVQKPSSDFKWNPNTEAPSVDRGDKVWFIGRNREWYVPTDEGGAGAISRLEPFERELMAEIHTVRPGTSGAPLFSETGIVGMIIQDETDEVAAVKIKAIKHYVKEKWRQPWDLKEWKQREDSKERTPVPEVSDDKKVDTSDQTVTPGQLLAELKQEREKIHVLIKQGNRDEGYLALKTYLKAHHVALKKYPQDAELLTSIGYAYKDAYLYSRGRDSADQRLKYLKTSGDYFSRAVKIDPKSVDAFNGLGDVYFYQKKYDTAIKAYRTVLNLTGGKNAYAERSLQRALKARGNKQEATSKNDRSLSALKNDRDYVERLFQSKKIKEGEAALKDHMAALRKALNTYPNEPEILTLMGYAYMNVFYISKGKVSKDRLQAYLKKAYSYFSRAIKFNFKNADAHNGAGYALLYQKKYDESIRAFSTALKLAGGKYPEAERGLRRAEARVKKK